MHLYHITPFFLNIRQTDTLTLPGNMGGGHWTESNTARAPLSSQSDAGDACIDSGRYGTDSRSSMLVPIYTGRERLDLQDSKGQMCVLCYSIFKQIKSNNIRTKNNSLGSTTISCVRWWTQKTNLAEDQQLQHGRSARPSHASLGAAGSKQAQSLLERRRVTQVVPQNLCHGYIV